MSWLISFPMNEWFSETMPRHQILQLPAMLVLGIISGVRFSKHIIIGFAWGIAILIFILSSLIFWMLPHSIDYAVINTPFNRLMHVNMLISGFLLIPVLRNTLSEIKIIFLGMLSAMVIATGFTLLSYNLLLCSSFNIEQQKEAGLQLVIIGLTVFASTIFIFFRGAGRS